MIREAGVAFTPVTITGDNQSRGENAYWNLPKRVLLSGLAAHLALTRARRITTVTS
jgi:hypothetical protein